MSLKSLSRCAIAPLSLGFVAVLSSLTAPVWGIPLNLPVLLANHDIPVPTTGSPSSTPIPVPSPSTGTVTPGSTSTTTTTSTTTSGSSVPNSSNVNQARFGCQVIDGQYTVMYYPESQPGQAYAWATPSAMGGGWSAQRRCAEISRRLEFYRPDGLTEMQTAIENNQNIVCVTTERVPTCRIVFTVPPNQDPIATRDRVFQNLSTADSGQATQGVNTFLGQGSDTQLLNDLLKVGNINLGDLNGGLSSTRSRSGINLRPFLDRADGGTGLRLQRSNAQTTGRPLNPGRFR